MLVTFLIVFKTQNAYQQYWAGLTHLDAVLDTTRQMAITACTMFDWENEKYGTEVLNRARRIVRFLAVHFFVVCEHFQRTGPDSTKEDAVKDKLRADIRNLLGESEFCRLYPGEPSSTPGSKSIHATAKSQQVVYWIELVAGRVLRLGGCPPPVMNGFVMMAWGLIKEVSAMDKIDKNQFPFPYNQIVKILIIVWVFTLPFFVEDALGAPACALLSGLVALGYFGLDEVAEILESPFGNDPNDIYLRVYGAALMEDLQMIFNGRDMQLESVFKDDRPLDFEEVLEAKFKDERSISENEGRMQRHFSKDELPQAPIDRDKVDNARLLKVMPGDALPGDMSPPGCVA